MIDEDIVNAHWFDCEDGEAWCNQYTFHLGSITGECGVYTVWNLGTNNVRTMCLRWPR